MVEDEEHNHEGFAPVLDQIYRRIDRALKEDRGVRLTAHELWCFVSGDNAIQTLLDNFREEWETDDE